MADLADESISAAAQEASEGKKGGLPIVPIIIVIVLIGAIAAVGWFVIMPMLSGGGGEMMGAGDPSGEEAEAGQGDMSAVYDPMAKRGIIEFADPFTVKLRRNEGVLETETYLLISLSLEVGSPEIQDQMTEDQVVMARIEDTINTFFAAQLPQNLEPSQWALLKEELITRINSQFDKMYHVSHVYFHDFLVQPGG